MTLMPFAAAFNRTPESTVTDLLIHLEDHALDRPVASPYQAGTGTPYVLISCAQRQFLLTPTEAQLAADSLYADPAWPGAFGDALALHEAALEASGCQS